MYMQIKTIHAKTAWGMWLANSKSVIQYMCNFFLKKIPTCNMNYTRTLACSMAANKTHSSWHRAMNQDAQTSKKAKVQHA